VKYLQILNASVLAFGAAMGLIMGVVCLLYAVNLELAPQLRAQMPSLLTVTTLFLGLAAASALAFMGQRRTWPGRWLLQALPLAPVAGLGLFLLSLRS
jgi:hypothetical protein